MAWGRGIAAILSLCLLASACVSRRQVLGDYEKALSLELENSSAPPETLVFFLVDGFSVPLAKSLLGQGRMPQIRSFFMNGQDRFFLGRATFPSLTHVNITSILTTSNVDTQPVIGNQIVHDGKVLNLESPFSQKAFGELIKPYSLFADLSRQGRTSMSFAPFYGDQATSRYGLDLKMGLAYRSGDYAYVDSELLQSMVYTLKKLPHERWPNFIFVHVIGVDATEHRHGHMSPQVQDYAEFVDTKLAPVFEVLLEAARSGRKIGAVLTSDHGMNDLKALVAIEERVQQTSPVARVINQGRLLAVNFDPASDAKQRGVAATTISRLEGVFATVEKSGERLLIRAAGRDYELRYSPRDCGREGSYGLSLDGRAFVCPSALDRITERFFYPYFATNIAAYFRSRQAPDLLVLAAESTSFGDYLHAHHGGLTPDEIFVPLLTWNIKLRSPDPYPQTFRLLQGLRTLAPASSGR